MAGDTVLFLSSDNDNSMIGLHRICAVMERFEVDSFICFTRHGAVFLLFVYKIPLHSM